MSDAASSTVAMPTSLSTIEDQALDAQMVLWYWRPVWSIWTGVSERRLTQRLMLSFIRLRSLCQSSGSGSGTAAWLHDAPLPSPVQVGTS